jgi:hypothetical protein
MQIGEVFFMGHIVPSDAPPVKPSLASENAKTSIFRPNFNHVSINRGEFAENSKFGSLP